jgi:ABC-type branched-subunit amino acid transport system substrate-binding protein
LRAARAFRLCVQDINKDPDQGPGRPFNLIHSDTHGKLEAFEAEANRLAAINHVAFLLGGTTAEEVERLDRAHLNVVTACAARPRGVSDGVWFTGIAAAQQGKVLARFTLHELKADSVLLVEDDRLELAREIAEAFAREFPLAKTDGKKPTLRRLRFGKDTKAGDLAKAVQDRLQQDSGHVVVFAGRADGLSELGSLTLPVVFAGEDNGGKALANQKALVEELYCLTAFMANDDAPRAKEFAARYHSAFGEEADVHAALAYESLKLLYEAMARTKDALTLQRMRKELGQLKEYNGLTGVLSFSEDRQLSRPAFVVRIDAAGIRAVKKYNAES